MNYQISTPVTTEPVSLAQAKLHLRNNSTPLASDFTTSQCIKPGAQATAAAYSLLGTAVDVLGKSAIVNLNAGTCGAGGSVAAKIQESDNGTSWTDWTGGAFTTVTEANDNAVYEKEYTGTKQYVRVVATVAAAPCSFSVDVVTLTGDTTEDTLISGLIQAAREYCEAITRRALATQTIKAFLDNFPCRDYIELPRPPLQSVTSVKYKDSAGTETIMALTTGYLVDSESNIGRIVLPYGVPWPSATLYPINPIRVEYVAGYYASNPIPETIRQAMLLLIGHWFVHRDEKEADVPDAVGRLLNQWKAGWF
jgi:uncharacterized phiE125 gp8 family phage protein